MTNIFKDSVVTFVSVLFKHFLPLNLVVKLWNKAHFAYTYDKPIDEETEVDVPAFLP